MSSYHEQFNRLTKFTAKDRTRFIGQNHSLNQSIYINQPESSKLCVSPNPMLPVRQCEVILQPDASPDASPQNHLTVAQLDQSILRTLHLQRQIERAQEEARKKAQEMSEQKECSHKLTNDLRDRCQKSELFLAETGIAHACELLTLKREAAQKEIMAVESQKRINVLEDQLGSVRRITLSAVEALINDKRILENKLDKRKVEPIVHASG